MVFLLTPDSRLLTDEKMTTLYCARWVLPMAAPAIEDGALVVEGSLIRAVGGRAVLIRSYPEAPLRDYGEAAILPGLVNAHSHLELTVMRGFLEREERDFPAWLKKLTLARLNQLTEDDLYASALWGAIEGARAGVTTFADASDTARASMRAVRDVGLRGTVYQESFGPDPRLARENFQKLVDKVHLLRELETELVRAGVSPHAVYTVSAPQLELIANFALTEHLPVMMHAAESASEELFIMNGRGPFAENLRAREIEWRAAQVSPIQYLERHGVLSTRPLLAHCIRVSDDDIEAIRRAGAGIAHCPKSNAKLDHGRAPFASFINRGARTGLGSDSVASNNTCDLFEEARFAALMARAAGDYLSSGEMVSADEVLFAATTGGARSLGLEERTGALSSGLAADFVVVNLAGAHQQPVYTPADALVWSSSARDVLLTVVAGREVFRDGRVVTVDEDALRHRVTEIGQRLAALPNHP